MDERGLVISIWSSPLEEKSSFIEQVTKPKKLTFETIVPGGFGACNFTVETAGWNSIRWYRDYVGYHVVVFDKYGRRAYEGKIVETRASVSGVEVSVEGYYSHSTDLTHGIIYPITTATSVSDIIIDTIDLTDYWWKDHSQIHVTTIDITPQDFTGELKLKDAIEAVLKYGDDSVNPRSLHFCIWENRRPWLFQEPLLTDDPSWQVYVKDFNNESGISISRSRKNLYNKIQVMYNDPDIGATFTDWEEDLVSQGRFGVREGSVNIGDALEGVAETIGELAIHSYANPTQSSTIDISGRVYNIAGAPDEPYMVRAGSLVRINDYDPSVAQLVNGQGGTDATISVIQRTNYSADSNSVSLTLGKSNTSLDIFFARLGMGSSASVR